jgi:hypothetical protein
MDIKDIIPGNSYGCKFRITTMLNELGHPVAEDEKLAIKGPGRYEAFGILVRRDSTNQLVEVYDDDMKRNFVVHWDDIWDVDDIEWI